MNKKVTTSIFLDCRRQKQNGTYPILLRLTHQQVRKYYSIGYSLSKSDYDKTMNAKPKGEFKDFRFRFDEKEREAISIIDKLDVFSFNEFKKQFFRTPGDHADLFFSFQEQIRKLKTNGQINTAQTYQTSFKSWQKFIHRDKLPFKNVTPDVLNSYEKHLLADGKSPTTVSISVRCVRKLFNSAIIRGDVDASLYPFRLYQPPMHRNVKKALPKSDIKKFFDYKPIEGSPESFYRDLFLFSYLCNGANLADICRLRYSNIQGDTIVFIRRKTANNRRVKPVLVSLTEPVQAIIDKWGTKPIIQDKHVFNILSDSMSPAKEVAKISQTTKMCNTYMRKICRKIGITENVTMYSARHSFASVLKLAGENISYISEALGHHSLATTEYYLASFDDKKRQEAAWKLTDFSDIE